MSLKSTLRSSDKERAWFWFHSPGGTLRASVAFRCCKMSVRGGIKPQWLIGDHEDYWRFGGTIIFLYFIFLFFPSKVLAHGGFCLFVCSLWVFFFLFFCSEIVSAKLVLKGDCWIGTLLCLSWSWYRSCSPGESALRHCLWHCLFSVLVTLLNYRPTVFALKQKAC